MHPLIALLLGTLAFLAVECSDSPRTIGERFIENFKAALADRDEAKISDLVDKNFRYSTCDFTASKKYFISHLTNLPRTAKYSITMKNAAEQAGGDIRIGLYMKGVFEVPLFDVFINKQAGTWKMFFLKALVCE